MTYTNKHVLQLQDGYYLVYNFYLANNRLLSLFEVKGDNIKVYFSGSSQFGLDTNFSVVEHERSVFNSNRKYSIYQLTDEEFLIFTIGAL